MGMAPEVLGTVGARTMRSADERIESLEKQVRTYRILVTLTFLLLVISHRHQIVRWVDGVGNWFGAVASARANQ